VFSGGKKGAGKQALGRSSGGYTTKLHAVCDSHGNPVRFIVTAGQASDSTQAIPLLEGFQATAVLADKGYVSEKIFEAIRRMGAEVVIPNKSNAVAPRQVDYYLYKARHLVENLFKDLKNFRRMATRYDKLDVAYLSFVHLASVYLWLK
jgi:transposase